MTLRVLIVGGGKVGMELASLLLASGHRVRLVEARREKVARLERNLPADAIIHGSGTEPRVLETAGVRQTDVVAAVTGADETNLVVTSLARSEFGVPRTIARVNDPRNAWMFTKEMGVDVAVNQADLIAHLIAEEMSLGDMMTLFKLRKGQYALVEERVHPTARAVGKALPDLELPAACVLVAIIRQGQLLLPQANMVLQPADEVLAVVHTAHLNELAALLDGQYSERHSQGSGNS
jgi:trk system potassium uptake protein TrkA